MKFYDDDPVELDCGCTAFAGDKYFEIKVPTYNKEGKITYRHLTYCGENECLGNILDGEFDYKTHYISTAYDNECDYGDRKYDEWKDRQLEDY